MLLLTYQICLLFIKVNAATVVGNGTKKTIPSPTVVQSGGMLSSGF